MGVALWSLLLSLAPAVEIVSEPAGATVVWTRPDSPVTYPSGVTPCRVEVSGPGGVWVHKIPTSKIDRMRAAALVGAAASRSLVDAAGDQGVVTAKFAALQLCEALRLGPDEDAAHLYSPGDWERIKEIPPGIRDRLARVSDALLGYDNNERSKLGNYRGGETFAAGASPGSAVSPAA